MSDIQKAGHRIYKRPDIGYTKGRRSDINKAEYRIKKAETRIYEWWIPDIQKAEYLICKRPNIGYTKGQISDVQKAGNRIYKKPDIGSISMVPALYIEFWHKVYCVIISKH
jgi:hypothetical protein